MNYNNYFKDNKTELNRERLIADETARISWLAKVFSTATI